MNSDKAVVRIQVRNPEGIQEQSVMGKILEIPADHLGKLAETIDAFSRGMLDRLTGVGKPSTVKLEFGVNAGGKAGIPFITEGKVDAHVTVAVEWRLKPDGT